MCLIVKNKQIILWHFGFNCKYIKSVMLTKISCLTIWEIWGVFLKIDLQGIVAMDITGIHLMLAFILPCYISGWFVSYRLIWRELKCFVACFEQTIAKDMVKRGEGGYPAWLLMWPWRITHAIVRCTCSNECVWVWNTVHVYSWKFLWAKIFTDLRKLFSGLKSRWCHEWLSHTYMYVHPIFED